MSYQMVNEELKIASCCLAELTLGQVQEFLKHWNDCKPIGTLTLFYDKDGTLVLNRDHKYYADFLEIAEGLLKLDLESAEEVAGKAPESLKENMNVILTCMQRRETLDMMRILEKDKFFPEAAEMEVLQTIRERKQGHNVDWPMVDAFHYGFVQGKRYERARKAKRSESEARENSPRVANVEWFKTQFLPLVKEFVKETNTLNDHDFAEVALQMVNSCRKSPCAQYVAASVVKTISRAREDLKGRTTRA